MISDAELIISVSIDHLDVFGEMSVQVSCPFFQWLFKKLSVYAVGVFQKRSPCWLHHLQTFSPIPRLSFLLLMVSFAIQKLLKLIRSHLFLLSFLLLWETYLRKYCCSLCQNMFCLMFSSRSFMMSCLICKSLSHFRFLFVDSWRKCCNFTDIHVGVLFS